MSPSRPPPQIPATDSEDFMEKYAFAAPGVVRWADPLQILWARNGPHPMLTKELGPKRGPEIAAAKQGRNARRVSPRGWGDSSLPSAHPS